MRIECGSTRERKVRSTLMFLLVAIFCVLYVYDGWVRYPRQNREEFRTQFPVEQREQLAGSVPYDTVTAKSVQAAREAVERSLNTSDTDAALAALTELYGGPPSHKNADGWYYFGPACMVTIHLEHGRPTGRVTSQTPGHGEKDIFLQRLIAWVLGGLSLIFLLRMVRAFRTRLVLSEEGLEHKGRGPIPWSAMTRLDSSRLDKKGWVDLHYDDDGEQSIRLDEYHIAAFDAVLSEICNRKGFVNPMRTAGGKSATEDSQDEGGEDDSELVSSQKP